MWVGRGLVTLSRDRTTSRPSLRTPWWNRVSCRTSTCTRIRGTSRSTTCQAATNLSPLQAKVRVVMWIRALTAAWTPLRTPTCLECTSLASCSILMKPRPPPTSKLLRAEAREVEHLPSSPTMLHQQEPTRGIRATTPLGLERVMTIIKSTLQELTTQARTRLAWDRIAKELGTKEAREIKGTQASRILTGNQLLPAERVLRKT